MLEASLDGFSTKGNNIAREDILKQLNLLDFPKYFGVFLSKVYEGENTIDVMLGNQNMFRIAWIKLTNLLKGEPAKTIEDCTGLCKDYGVGLKITDNWLRHKEDYAILRIPGPDDNERPWILCINHLGKERTPPWLIYLALESLLKTYLKEQPAY